MTGTHMALFALLQGNDEGDFLRPKFPSGSARFRRA